MAYGKPVPCAPTPDVRVSSLSCDPMSEPTSSPSDARALSMPVRYLKGIGPKRAAALRSVGVETVEDLLLYIPRDYLDRSRMASLADLPLGREVTAIGTVAHISSTPSRRKAPFVVALEDDTGTLQCVWFQGAAYMKDRFSVGDSLVVSGRVEVSHGNRQMIHPEFEIIVDEDQELMHTARIIPVYPLAAELKRTGLTSRGLRRLIKPALVEFAPLFTDSLPPQVLARNSIIPLPEAMIGIHFPDSLEEAARARSRLAFEEWFYLQLMLALKSHQRKTKPDGIAFARVGRSAADLLGRLPFELTNAQKRVLREIRADMKRPATMSRLLQGDVGSGKTLVALVAMLIATENGYQAALMAPTEILAEQHFLTLHGLLEELGVAVVLLVGGMRSVARREALSAIESGEAHIVVGTHALIEEGVAFRNLGLVIIDEQHRFGVMQRATLQQKGLRPDVLVMTATPIPRTLSLTVYGDLDVSIIDEMPPGRRPIKTAWRSESKREEIFGFVRNEVGRGRQAYIVYPLVEESEKSDLKAATESYEELRAHVFPDCRLALLHGRMRNEEKEAAMAAFKQHEVDILVSTTVIEVGVDVPNAAVMVVEHAERFGLSQLHQLRGRVGRGEHQSYCILIAYYPVSEEARTRLSTMARTNDGFEIAEVDLELRGPGEFFGTRQSGMPELRIADVLRDQKLLIQARKEAFALVEEDPHLELPEHARVKETLLGRHLPRMGLAEVA